MIDKTETGNKQITPHSRELVHRFALVVPGSLNVPVLETLIRQLSFEHCGVAGEPVGQ